MSNYFHRAPSPTKAKAMTLYEAIKFAIDREMSLLIFESDCKFVVELVNASHALQNEIGDIVSSCKDLLSTRNSYFMKHIRRQTNMIARTISRSSLSLPS
jgi:hypothetical protein